MAHQLALLVLLLVSPAAMRAVGAAGACASEKFPAGRTYATCQDLPQLGAALHWTYDRTKFSLSVAFVAAPAGTGGWVAWGLNPTGEGMAGTQALVALKGSSAPTVKTYNITGYVPLGGASTPIAFPATDLAADEGAGGKIRLYGKLQLHKGMKSVNQVWQVGSSVTGGAPDKHAFGAANLASKTKLVLAGKSTAINPAHAPALAPAPAPTAGTPSSAVGGGSDSGASATAAPSPVKSAATAAGVSAPALAVLALAGFLAMV
ncbi:hypothetical protein GUJ93_ZPchr0010g10210 [Zizania palustris]|uniref:DOMON domain-containing protein n=1 Tax=Zizania palustris TaxID=103762 RepID=A0A8J6BIJ2_ZIZPA|nr:hypothetical protein GUJ93_ZPchr0010g10210 [Zizania palustris]